MSLDFCPKCDKLRDTDFDTDCTCEETDVQVAPGIWQSKEDYEGNRDYDAMKDGENFV